MVRVQQNKVIQERSRRILSAYREWEDKGKPVTAKQINPADVREYVRLTLTSVSERQACGFVSRDDRDKLAPGLPVFETDGDTDEPRGVISRVADEPDRQTAMYAVTADITLPLKEKYAVVFARVNTYSAVISVPNEILDSGGGEYYVWKVEQGRAEKKKVELFSRNGYGAIISAGISPGDLVIYTGQSQLREGDNVRIIGGTL